MVDSPPFELVEQGWGEFDIGITVHFTDPNEKPVSVVHTLKLFAPDPANWPPQKPVVSEHIDQIVFIDPTEWFYNDLLTHKQEEGPALITYYSAASVDDDSQLEKILSAQRKVRQQIWRLKEMYEATAAEAAVLRRQIDVREYNERRNAANARMGK